PCLCASSKKAIITVAKEIVVATVLDENSDEVATRAWRLNVSGIMSAIFFVRLPRDNPTPT
ncbi:MAG: hypothetical protein ACYSRQ_00285, partial [Planctomycetota bacterium]